jgi:sulfite exporter TauE/SafE
MAGLLGSGHCFGMCGGIAAGLGSVSKPGLLPALAFNFGRLMSYALLGAISATVLSSLGEVLNVPQWGFILRLMTAVIIILIGLQFVFGWQLLGGIERLGARVWKRVLPFAVRASAMPGGVGRLLLGLCWGLLPCGLVYSVLFSASSTGSVWGGALVMFTFGVGTLPSMLGMSLAAPALKQFLADQWARKLMGFALIVLAVLSVILLMAHHPSLSAHSGHH